MRLINKREFWRSYCSNNLTVLHFRSFPFLSGGTGLFNCDGRAAGWLTDSLTDFANEIESTEPLLIGAAHWIIAEKWNWTGKSACHPEPTIWRSWSPYIVFRSVFPFYIKVIIISSTITFWISNPSACRPEVDNPLGGLWARSPSTETSVRHLVVIIFQWYPMCVLKVKDLRCCCCCFSERNHHWSPNDIARSYDDCNILGLCCRFGTFLESFGETSVIHFCHSQLPFVARPVVGHSAVTGWLAVWDWIELWTNTSLTIYSLVFYVIFY